jgi:hypothetical protein
MLSIELPSSSTLRKVYSVYPIHTLSMKYPTDNPMHSIHRLWTHDSILLVSRVQRVATRLYSRRANRDWDLRPWILVGWDVRRVLPSSKTRSYSILWFLSGRRWRTRRTEPCGGERRGSSHHLSLSWQQNCVYEWSWACHSPNIPYFWR